MKGIGLSFFISICFISLGLEAQINTSSNRYVGCAPDTFKFYTVGNTHSGQQWNSGNGSTPTIDSPIFSYTVPGTYTVTIGSLTRTITIHPKLNFNFVTDSSKTGCFPFRFNLKDITSYPTGVTPTVVRWIYQNGGSKLGSPAIDVIPSYYLHYCYVTMQVNTSIPSCYGELKKDSFFKILDVPRAKIDLTPNTACKVPFTPIITNKSKDTFNTTLTYLWKWDQPAVGSSTNINPPNLIFTTNTLATITLAARNQYGCLGYDTVRLKVDTPFLDYTASSRVCRSPYYGKIKIKDLDTSKFIYQFSSQLRLSGANIFNKETNLVGDSFFFSGFYADNPNIDTWAYLYITKINKADTSCKTTVAKKVNICQSYPSPEFRFSRNCGTPFRDTIVARRWTPCWDVIDFKMFYTDKYGIMIRTDSFNVRANDSASRAGPDTILPYGLDRLLKTDEYYRRGPLTLYTKIAFRNLETNCVHTFTDWYRGFQESLFRPHLVNHYTKGCKGRKDSFVVHHFGEGSIDSVIWYLGDGSVKRTKTNKLDHVFVNPGTYKTYAIVKNTLGCIDTVNPVYTYRADSILPALIISNKNFCISDSTSVAVANSSNFDRWYFVTDKEKSFNCFEQINFTHKNFYNVGKQYIYLIAEKLGCTTSTMDSLTISGPKFNLNYDFRCSRRDSIQFFVTDTADIQTKINWNFGDGKVFDTLRDTVWHKFNGDSTDYMVRLSSENPNGCRYEDSALIKIRKVKAIFTDTLFCRRINPTLFLNGTPYTFNPSLSRNADMNQGYRYTWQLESIAKPGNPSKKYPPYTSSDSIPVYIWEDTINLTLIARDINGCDDKVTKRIIVTDNHIDFKVNYVDSCPPAQWINLQNLSTSPFGISNVFWSVSFVKNNNDTQFFVSTDFNTLFYANASIADTFKIRLEIQDTKNCQNKVMEKFFYFTSDTSNLIVPDTTCQELTHNIRSTENDILKYQYRWYVNNVLIPNDTTYQLNYKFSNLGIQNIKLEKTRRQTGCTRTFTDVTIVYPRPRLQIDNSFDLAANKCFPGVTTVMFYDSAFIPSLEFKYLFKGSPRTVNPATIDLDKGPNLIEAIFWTSYGCLLTIPIHDTVYGPEATLSLDKPAICKNDSITFTLINAVDVDTVLWSFGDGTIRSGIERVVTHRYTTANAFSDSVPISFIVYAPGKSCPLAKVDTVLVYEALSKHHLNNKIDTAYCFGPVTIHNTAPRADYFKWNFGNGDTSLSSDKLMLYNYQQPGTYKIKQYAYRSPLGCVDSSTTTVILFPKPKVSAQVDSVCLGKQLDIKYQVDIPNSKLFLSPDSFKGSPYSSSPISTQITETTRFNLKATSPNGCSDSVSLNAIVIQPRKERSWDTIIEMGKEITLPVGYDTYWSYTWTPKWKNPSCENCVNPVMRIFDSVTYNLTIEDFRKCFKSSYKYVIRLYPDIVVRVPTAFSPNGDGNNDILYARGFGIKKLVSFKIFNRQGQLIFYTNDEKTGWDGNYKDLPQNSDVFFYTYEAESFIPGKIVSGEGNFMLLR